MASGGELAAYTGECEAVERTLAMVDAPAWERAALGEWNLAELVAHMTRGAGRLAKSADRDPGGREPDVDRVSYWRFTGGTHDPHTREIARHAVEAAAGVEASEWPQRFARAWRASAARFTEIGPDALVWTVRGPMRAADYLATRVLEAVVHHYDVRAALDLPPAATPAAERMVLTDLEALLGERRPRNFGRRRFVLAATGRIEVDDPRYPLLR